MPKGCPRALFPETIGEHGIAATRDAPERKLWRDFPAQSDWLPGKSIALRLARFARTRSR
jgi:hypothetical protein